MKKYLFAIALGAMTVAACNKSEVEIKEVNDQPVGQKITLVASGEAYGTDTKATLDGAAVKWEEGDQVAVRFYKGNAKENVAGYTDGYGAWDAAFTLNPADAGKTSGSFEYTGDGVIDGVHWGYAAFYPKFDSNVGGEPDYKVWFHMQKVYEGYTSGRILMPMVANLNMEPDGMEGRPSAIALKHAGAGVRVTLKDVPASCYQASLTVPGKKIVGWYGVDPANAGTDAIVADDSENADEQTVYIKFATSDAKRDMTIIFPLPTVDMSTNGMILKLYFGEGVEFWSKTLSHGPDLTRGQVLAMPELTVDLDPDSKVAIYFNLQRNANNICLKSNDDLKTADWPGDPAEGTENIGGLKFYKWTYSAPLVWGKTISYDLIDPGKWSKDGASYTFTPNKMAYYFMMDADKNVTAIAKAPATPSITIDGDFADWDAVLGNVYTSSKGNAVTTKVYSDGTDLYLYHKVVPGEGLSYDLSGWTYFRMYMDLDNDTATGSDNWFYTGADPLATSPAVNNFLVWISKGTVDKAVIQYGDDSAIPAAGSIKVVDNSGDSIELEMKLPLSNITLLGENKDINVFSNFSVGLDGDTLGKLLGVLIP